jgi:branched-chain amino acid aminotransferase
MQINYENLKGVIWYNGKLIRAPDAKLHVLSHSLHFGSAVFEGIRVYNGKSFKLKEHINRLIESAKLVGIEIPFSKNKIINSCKLLIRKQKLDGGYLRPIVWRGGQSMAPTPNKSKINFAIAGWNWPVYYSSKAKEKGITLTISRWKRPPNECAPTFSKCSSLYTICTLAKLDAEKKGYDDALMLDLKNYICESTSSNIFFIKKNKIYTPIADCFLNGITRKEVIKICKKNKFNISETRIKIKDLPLFDSCFLTGTAAEITSVRKINTNKFKNKNNILNKIISDFTQIIKKS